MNTQSSFVPNYPFSLALVDSVPVIFFFASTVLLFIRLKSPLFFTGSLITFLAGSLQVAWKMTVSLSHKNIWWLHAQMKYLMPLGFLLMIIAIILMRNSINWQSIRTLVFKLPIVIFFILTLICFITMIVLSITLGIKDIASQWIEETINIFFQASVFACILCYYIQTN
mgnify:FL=1